MMNSPTPTRPPFSRWYKSSRSNGDNACVEVLHLDDAVKIRDSKYTGDPADQPTLTVSADQWSEFLCATLNGGGPAVPAIHRDSEDFVTLSHNGIDLTYNPAEWRAFVAGVVAGEFNRESALTA